MLMFEGTLPHVARGVSRICPVMRVTLMFKTEMTDR
jgi:SM-20-related protein